MRDQIITEFIHTALYSNWGLSILLQLALLLLLTMELFMIYIMVRLRASIVVHRRRITLLI